jgi:inosine/xanthosine triphosphatase
MKRNIWVASANPVKIEAARQAFQKVFPGVEWSCHGQSVSSGIPDQPMGIGQTLTGVINRVIELKKLGSPVDYYVGMEGGITREGGDCYAFAWMYVESKEGIQGKAMTGFFQLPPPVVERLDEGLELGHAMDELFSKENTKQKGGAVGLLTGDLIDRTQYYVHAMVLALIPFINTAFFNSTKQKK